ncbi:MAG: DNA gyrase/topoisomerase IV subunit A, partial [Bacteroidales bacterium]
IRKVDDNTAKDVEILVHLQAGVSSDKTIDALYAFTDCEISISPNCCVIEDNKPHFLTVSHVLRSNTDNSVNLLRSELEIEKGELLEQLQFASLEKLFIAERMYKDKEFENASSMDIAIAHLDKRFDPYKPSFIRAITKEDLLRLMEIKMARILRFNADKAEETIANIKQQIEKIDYHLEHIIDYTIRWYQQLKDKYGKLYPRQTEIRSFDSIEATKVVEANEKLYVNYEEGFIGTGMKKDEFVAPCSDIDDIIIFYKDGKYKIVKVADKLFVGKGILYLNVFKRNDTRTIYNVVYRDGKSGVYYIKRFNVTGITRDKEYDVTQGKPGSRIVYFSANPNGEAEVIRVTLKPAPRLKKLLFEKDFGEIAIKGRASMGNVFTKNDIHKITLKAKGASTLGGLKVWFDPDIKRLNTDERGQYLGDFEGDDLILVVLKSGEYYTSSYELSNHYEDNLLFVEKFDANKIWSLAFYDAEQNYYYIKRFQFEASNRKQLFIGETSGSKMVLLSQQGYPRFEVTFGGGDSFRQPLEIDVEEFIGVKSFKARGKRISTYLVDTVTELEPLRFPEEQPAEEMNDPESEEEPQQEEEINEKDLLDEITGQLKLF